VGGIFTKSGVKSAGPRLRLTGREFWKLLDRILTKPHRITEEMRKDLTIFITSLPIRIMTKPIRLARELMDVVKED
jgi:hypothetical protein